MSETFLHRGCPACGSKTVSDRGQVGSSPPAEEMPFPELRASWRGFFQERKSFFTYVRCAECGQVYCPRYFIEAQLAELYGQMGDNTAGQDEAMLARAQRGYWRLLTRSATLPRGGYVELGPDIGLFTREAATSPALGPFWMIEPNRVVHPALDRLLGEKPHTLLSELGQVEQIPDGSVSLVVAIHVLDHLLEPQKLLERLARKLAPGGVLFAITHSEKSLAARAFGERWPAYCLQHPQLYSPRTLRQSYERVGLRDVRIARTTNYFPAGYLLRHFLFAARLGRVEVPLPASWIVGVKLGNIAAIGVK
jgi:SAM-dependent methyltransferase